MLSVLSVVFRAGWRLVNFIFWGLKSSHQKRHETLAQLIDGKKDPLDLYHWCRLVEHLYESPQCFYQSFEEALHRRELPGLKLTRIERFESGIFSAKREIIKISRRDHIFEMYAAQFGAGFYVAYRVRMGPPFIWRLLLILPGVGTIIFKTFHPLTHYRFDTALIFQKSVHSAVLEVLEERIRRQGLRRLQGAERSPIFSEFFATHDNLI